MKHFVAGENFLYLDCWVCTGTLKPSHCFCQNNHPVSLVLIRDTIWSRGEQLFSSAGQIGLIFVCRGPNSCQICFFKAKNGAYEGRMWPAGFVAPLLLWSLMWLLTLKSLIKLTYLDKNLHVNNDRLRRSERATWKLRLLQDWNRREIVLGSGLLIKACHLPESKDLIK